MAPAKSKKGSSKRGLTIRRPKKTSKKTAHALADVPSEHAFYLKGGGALMNLSELADALKSMDESVFSFHANNSKNDFSSWIRDVMGEHNLSLSIAGRDRAGTRQDIMKFINTRQSKR